MATYININLIGKLFPRNSALPEESIVNWQGLSRKYNLRDENNIYPLNGGQIVLAMAKAERIDVYQFNKNKSVSGRDYLRRVRRSKKRLLRTNISIPAPRPSKLLRTILNNKVCKGEINIGKSIAPKAVVRTTINKDGKVTEQTKNVYGRKIDLTKIIEKETKRLYDAGVLVYRTDEEYDTMTRLELQNRLCFLQESFNSNQSTAEI